MNTCNDYGGRMDKIIPKNHGVGMVQITFRALHLHTPAPNGEHQGRALQRSRDQAGAEADKREHISKGERIISGYS